MAQYPPNNPQKNPYQSPVSQSAQSLPSKPVYDYSAGPPSVMVWQMVYVVLMSIMYILFGLLGVFMFFYADTIANGDPNSDAELFKFLGLIYAAMGIGLTVLFGAGIFWRRGNGGWIFNTVLIAIGLTSCITWPLTIPLLIFWLKHKDWICRKPLS